MHGTLAQRSIELLEGWPMFDSAIVSHGFTPYMRDYDVLVETPAAAPDGTGSFLEGKYRFRFTHCVVADVSTAVAPDVWLRSWTEEFVDYRGWEVAGCPDGYVWGVEYMEAYPGGAHVVGSPLAAEWTAKLGRAMHEVQIHTNAHNLRLVFHDLRVHRVAKGDHTTRTVADVEPEPL